LRVHYHLAFKPQPRAGVEVMTFPVIGPGGELYCAFDLEEARRYKAYCLIYRGTEETAIPVPPQPVYNGNLVDSLLAMIEKQGG
jgi:hypothetical protein